MASPLGLQEDVGATWSEHTSPSSDGIEEIVRSRTSYATTHPIRPDLYTTRLPNQFSGSADGIPRHFHGFSLAPLDVGIAYNCSEGSISSMSHVNSAATTITAWNNSRFSEEEDEDVERLDMNWDNCEFQVDDGDGEDDEAVLVPKMEPVDGADIPVNSLNSIEPVRPVAIVAGQAKRPRGRPRKHPKPNPDAVSKVTKGRSKTGCITCRKRKKKCDETKPECMNCQKNSYKCLGYPGKSEYLTGAEKAERARLRRADIPRMSVHLPAMIRGVETPGDRIFLEHFVDRLSCVLTFESSKQNAFKDMLLPMAVESIGLMHSILALSSKHINWSSTYGQAILVRNPNIRRKELSDRSEYHSSQATIHLHKNIGQQIEGTATSVTLSSSIGQMLCLVLESIAEGKTGGEHRSHLIGYQQLIRDSPPEDGPFVEFVEEFFQYHILADQLTSLPSVGVKRAPSFGPRPPASRSCSPTSPPRQEGSPEHNSNMRDRHHDRADHHFVPGINHAIRMLGVTDGLFEHMSQITDLRNEIRQRRAANLTPLIDAPLYYRGAMIDAFIRDWSAAWAPSDERYIPGLLYRQMLWVYLWRTLYPPPKVCSEDYQPDQRIIDAVDGGLDLLEKVDRGSRGQTLLLAPVFVVGCASFQHGQRDRVKRALTIVRDYTQLRNAKRVEEVLEEVWKAMDAREEESWDWQGIMARMGVDFLAT